MLKQPIDDPRDNFSSSSVKHESVLEPTPKPLLGLKRHKKLDDREFQDIVRPSDKDKDKKKKGGKQWTAKGEWTGKGGMTAKH